MDNLRFWPLWLPDLGGRLRFRRQNCRGQSRECGVETPTQRRRQVPSPPWPRSYGNRVKTDALGDGHPGGLVLYDERGGHGAITPTPSAAPAVAMAES